MSVVNLMELDGMVLDRMVLVVVESMGAVDRSGWGEVDGPVISAKATKPALQVECDGPGQGVSAAGCVAR